MSDRTQAPSGAGYALENRIILSRILPRMFHSGKVLRLAPFFKFLNPALMTISGLEKHEPFVVMLSSGPSSPTYFEHVFLARYLGITLVKSSDLTIRDDTVFLKTLGGLNQVDVFSKNYLTRLLEQTRGNISETSRLSGIEWASIQKIINRLHMDISRFRST